MPVGEMDESRVRWLEKLFAAQAFMGLLGVQVVSFGAGRCVLELSTRPDLTQQSGVLHAGVVAALADNAAGGAASTLMADGAAAVTAEYKISFVAPAVGERLVARAEVVHAGNTLTVCESRVSAVRGDEETLCAVALVTLWPMRVGMPDAPADAGGR